MGLFGKSNGSTGKVIGKAAPKGTPPGKGIPVAKSKTGTRVVAKSKPRQS
jgi:hypothetical protein